MHAVLFENRHKNMLYGQRVSIKIPSKPNLFTILYVLTGCKSYFFSFKGFTMQLDSLSTPVITH